MTLSHTMALERATIERIYRERYLGFRNALATVTGSYEAAHDVVQEGFARALAKRGDFRGGSPEAWIWTIAYRCALAARPRHDANAEPESALVEPERDPALALALRELSPRRRLMVFLRYFADLEYAQIAEVCGVSEGTVAATLAQARAYLHDVLELEGAEDERQPA
jgi:RNA polymerase sigma-70 factor (ECF subfamily)